MQLTRYVPTDALAQVHPGPHGPHPGPHWGGPMGGTGMGAVGGAGGWLVVLLLVLLFTALVVALAYALTRVGDPDDGAMRTLRERYAAGDLDDEEFDRRRDRLIDGE